MNAEAEGLVQDLTAQQGNPHVSSDGERGRLADWLTDHPERAGELLAVLLRELPEVMGRVIREHLRVEIQTEEHTPSNSYRSIVTGLHLRVSWQGWPVCSQRVQL